MTKKREAGVLDVNECAEKIAALLTEYNCELYLEEDIGICLADKDTAHMECLVNNENIGGV